MKKYVIEQEPLQAVLDYLSTKPYKETVILINNIQNTIKPLDETKIYTQVDLKAAKDLAYNTGLKDATDIALNVIDKVDTMEQLSDA